MIPELVERADDIECIVTKPPSRPHPRATAIREHMPRFNSMLKDGKSFPYLAMTNEEYPRIMYTRRPPKSAQQWGPFPNAGAAKQVMQLLRRQFGIRDCKELLPQGCRSMHIGLCAGPCIDGTGYDERVKTVRRVLNGDAAPLLEELVAEMEAASETQAYEVAAQHCDMIRAFGDDEPTRRVQQGLPGLRRHRHCP